MNPWLFDLVNGWAGLPVIDAVMRFSAQWLILASFALTAVLLARRLAGGDQAGPGWACVALGAAFGLERLAAAVHPDPRPFQVRTVHQVLAHGPGQAFPSDHATAACALAFATAVFLSRTWGGVLGVCAFLIGFARVYCGLHDPADVAAGAMVAALGVAVALVGRALATHWSSTGGRACAA